MKFQIDLTKESPHIADNIWSLAFLLQLWLCRWNTVKKKMCGRDLYRSLHPPEFCFKFSLSQTFVFTAQTSKSTWKGSDIYQNPAFIPIYTGGKWSNVVHIMW